MNACLLTSDDVVLLEAVIHTAQSETDDQRLIEALGVISETIANGQIKYDERLKAV